MWKDLTLQQKAEIMRMSVANGVTDINTIRDLYDGQVEHEFKGGGYKSSPAIRKRISNWEGSSMYALAPDTGKVNRPFSAEERDFWNAIPNDIKPLLTQDMADALFSTSYNIGAGNFKKRVVPQLRKVLLEGKGTVEDITRAMYGTRDKEPKMKGLRTRRAIERNLFTEAYNKKYENPTTATYNKIYGTPRLDISNDILYNPAQELQWTPITQESPKINPISIPTNNIEIPIPKVEAPTVIPIEERIPLEARLPNIASLLSYLPDQQMVAQPRIETPQYTPTPIDVWDEPYLLFGRT